MCPVVRLDLVVADLDALPAGSEMVFEVPRGQDLLDRRDKLGIAVVARLPRRLHHGATADHLVEQRHPLLGGPVPSRHAAAAAEHLPAEIACQDQIGSDPGDDRPVADFGRGNLRSRFGGCSARCGSSPCGEGEGDQQTSRG